MDEQVLGAVPFKLHHLEGPWMQGPTHICMSFPGCDQDTTPASKNPAEKSPRNMSSQHVIKMDENQEHDKNT